MHTKRLQWTVRASERNPGLADLMLEQFGGPQDEPAAACRCFDQYLADDDPGRRDMPIDIATEELSHLEVIGTIVAMLNKGATGPWPKASAPKPRCTAACRRRQRLARDAGALRRRPALHQLGRGAVHGRLHRRHRRPGVRPALEHRRRVARQDVDERLINWTDDPGVKEALGFLMPREIAHQQSFEKALYAIQPNFPVGKLGGQPEFTNVYFNTSRGDADTRGPWNEAPTFDDRDAEPAVDGGSGLAQVTMPADDIAVVEQAAQRRRSDTASDPVTGAMLGMAPAGGANGELPFAVVALVRLTGGRRRMGEFANGPATACAAWTVAALIVGLNL